MPAPETVGLTLASDEVAKVTDVAAASAAEKAGFRPGDEIVTIAGQPLISGTDFSWALHRSGDTATLPAVVKRGGAEQKLDLALTNGWRDKAESSKRVGFWPMRAMAAGGMVLEDLSDEERSKRGLNDTQLALFAKGVGQYGKHAAAKNAGFQKEDVIIEIDGITTRTSESGLIQHLLTHRMPGTKVKTVVLRGGKRLELMLPMQ
jgi:S1-C subfamily serine protease